MQLKTNKKSIVHQGSAQLSFNIHIISKALSEMNGMSDNIAHQVKTITNQNEYLNAMKSSNLVTIMFIDIP